MKEYISAKDIRYQLANLKQLTFEVTDACNLSCKYCAYGEFYNDYDLRENKNISLPAAIKMINYLVELWNSEYNMSATRTVFISFYGGEPLLNMPFIKSIVQYVENIEVKSRNFVFSMTTNAILLQKNIDYLVKHNFNLLISLDGNELNNSYRVYKTGKPAYTDIKNNIDTLLQKYPEYFKTKVNFNSVLHNRNSVEQIYKYFKADYNKIPSIGELNNMGIRENKIELFRQTYRNTYQSLYQAENYEVIERDMFLKSATYQSITAFIHQYSGFVYRNYTDLIFGNDQKKSIPTGTCVPFSRRLFMTVNGKILPCERIGQQFELGMISESEICIDLDAIANKYNSYYAKFDQQCHKCYKTKACIQCIFNIPKLEEDHPICPGFVNETEFLVYKSKQMNFLRNHPEEYYRIMENVIVE